MSDFLTILGILLAVIFGIPSLILYFRKYNSGIIFFEEEFINLQDKLAKTIPELKIIYNNNEINNQLFLLRGYFFLNGKKDIVKEDIEKQLYIELKNKGIWHKFKIISLSKDLKCNLTIDNQKLNFNFGLLKDNEYIYFECLLESNHDIDAEKPFSISHRIANIGKIKYLELKNHSDFLLNLFLFIFMTIFMFFLTLSSIPKVNEYKLNYEINNLSDKEINSLSYTKIYELKEKVTKEYNYFNLLFNKTKKYQLNEEKYNNGNIVFYIDDKSDLYIFLMLLFLNSFAFIVTIFLSLEYFDKSKLIKSLE